MKGKHKAALKLSASLLLGMDAVTATVDMLYAAGWISLAHVKVRKLKSKRAAGQKSDGYTDSSTEVGPELELAA